MLSFEERMALLDQALSKHTPESLLAELQKFPAYGPSILSDISCLDIDELFNQYGYRIINKSPLTLTKEESIVSGLFANMLFQILVEYNEKGKVSLPELKEIPEKDKIWLENHLNLKSYSSPFKFKIYYNEHDFVENDNLILFHFINERELKIY